MTQLKVADTEGEKQSRVIEGYTVSALLRLADTHYHERFDKDNEAHKEMVRKTFEVFSKDGYIMRTDLVRVLLEFTTAEDINLMLESLNYKSSHLTFKIEEIAEKVIEKICSDVSAPADQDILASFSGGQ